MIYRLEAAIAPKPLNQVVIDTDVLARAHLIGTDPNGIAIITKEMAGIVDHEAAVAIMFVTTEADATENVTLLDTGTEK